MVSLKPSRLLQATTLALCTSAIAFSSSAFGQSANQQLAAEEAGPSSHQFRPLNQENSLMSRVGAQSLMSQAAEAVGNENYALAQQKLQDARQVFNQLSNFYQELAASFSGVDNRIANSQRDLAVETAQKRDEATYQLALVHRAQNEGDLAVPLLVQVIRSQNPTTEMGKKAYQQLFELGFVDLPYPKPDDSEQLATEEAGPNNSEFSPLNQENSLMSRVGAQSLMSQAAEAVGNENYALAQQKLQDARQVFNQLSNFYQELAASFSGIDSQIANSKRDLAVETAQKRDEATYQLALVHRAQNEADVAVPLLVQVIRSQNPTTEMGKKAYQQLFELGFVDSPYLKLNDSESTSAAPQ